jgi:hypothetical protein
MLSSDDKLSIRTQNLTLVFPDQLPFHRRKRHAAAAGPRQIPVAEFVSQP